MATAFLLGPRRDRVLVRVGRWCLVASWVQVMLWLVLPELLLPHLPAAGDLVGVAAGLRASGTDLLPAFASLVGAGTTCLVAGLAGRYLSPVLHHRDIPPVGRRASARTVAARERAAQEQSARDPSDGEAAQPGPYEVRRWGPPWEPPCSRSADSGGGRARGRGAALGTLVLSRRGPKVRQPTIC